MFVGLSFVQKDISYRKVFDYEIGTDEANTLLEFDKATMQTDQQHDMLMRVPPVAWS